MSESVEAVLARLDERTAQMDRRTEDRFDALEKRFDESIDLRFDALDQRLDSMNTSASKYGGAAGAALSVIISALMRAIPGSPGGGG